jgi:Domain of unknown function (DUF4263)
VSPLEITYSLAADPPPAMSPQVYEQRLTLAWHELLKSDPTEPDVQTFLETHPSMVPGAHVGLGRLGQSGHAPFPGALIAQPTLRGLTTRTPDFLWIAKDSVYLNPIFVEIEAPGKRWVTKTGQQHSQLTQALHQLEEWTDWFRRAENQSVFMEAYDIPRVIRRREIEPIHVLIYGRQRENPEAIAKLRRHLTTRTRFVVPYEHLKPDAECFGYLSAQLRTAGYEAVSVPPTVTVGPRHASEWRLIHGKAEAVACSDWMSVERRAFLAGRFAYWDEWGRDGRGIVRVADEE